MKYLDESLRFYVDESYPNKVIDYYSLPISEIERLLNLRLIKDKNIINSDLFVQGVKLNDWFEVAQELEYLKSLNDYSTIISILGYEIIDEHVIKIYYRKYISNF
ncbi:hypothetical protein [Heyndrickxia sporothermodurans]|uniref:Uncharacterized protein n=1 Tax=Heyndrickxia sporothermodurans TaxID=46224 RepID=A0AB37H9Q0_9BACI|nr:hypothetical protein [Heyndrickxia sporothermodurans]MBL5769030.1 hypothetical protein [Heyndrickxia sporothermodurans]MBL5772731.1 hypothetical protein [Heyndrickxia sporothermodurans]MBL5783433.1 hypothetical protein [Heyndrickxia sporothermodurans]MBL5786903.1 hypothetical protein [Heyndrickxia sporothermodurans]MBL5790446.1 hypothetical protein [Heyndrickxia sporothermodurans]